MMGKKTLILNGSPRPEVNTAHLIHALQAELEGEVLELSAFRAKIAPCVDCRRCWETARCAVRDEMDLNTRMISTAWCWRRRCTS